MLARPSVLLLSSLFVGLLAAQGPFQYREARLLELQLRKGGEAMEHDSLGLGCVPTLDGCSPYLAQIDDSFRSGNFELGEAKYQELLNIFRQKYTPEGVDVAWMLARRGQSYLEVRDFDRAYESFTEAVRIRRTNLELLAKIPARAALFINCREHLISLLVMLGRLDTAKGDLGHASQKLAEAVAIGKQPDPPVEKYAANATIGAMWLRSTYEPRYLDLRLLENIGALHKLDAWYFQSLILEKQGKWKEAESGWQEMAKRDPDDSQLDVLKDVAAFYARRGEFHTAADVIRRRQTEIAGKPLKPGYVDYFQGESDVAMAEILAMDRWQTDGPDAAAALLPLGAPLAARMPLIEGADSARARLLEFSTNRAFLHMSILLDGDPSPERVARAYEALQLVKGKYLATIAEIATRAESSRGNSPFDMARTPQLVDALAAERGRRAHLLVASAVDGKPFRLTSD
jgi:tetratricopeptide (TPR) repeat protein